MQQRSLSGENAARYLEAVSDFDVRPYQQVHENPHGIRSIDLRISVHVRIDADDFAIRNVRNSDLFITPYVSMAMQDKVILQACLRVECGLSGCNN